MSSSPGAAVVADDARLGELAQARAAAEAAEWEAMLARAEHLEAEYATTTPAFRRQAQVASIPLEIGAATGLSEHQVTRRVCAAERVRDQAPQTWWAFGAGRVDASRVLAIADAVAKLKRETSIVRLDQGVVVYAQSHTLAEVRRWLKRFIARVEPDSLSERAEAERADRCVDVVHGDDGMSWLSAYLPSFVAAAIDSRLTKEAKAFGADDPRTSQQRRADLLAAWLTRTESTEAAVHAAIAVTISADALAGVNDDPVISADGGWAAPAGWIKELARSGGTLWNRIITDAAGHTLDHTYLGRFTPDVLDQALAFRDGVCQAPGCTRSADQCDNDHREPWPNGPTTGTNMWPLCRRHHRLKGHEVITWHLPSGRTVPAERVAHSPPLRDISWTEHALAEFAAHG